MNLDLVNLMLFLLEWNGLYNIPRQRIIKLHLVFELLEEKLLNVSASDPPYSPFPHSSPLFPHLYKTLPKFLFSLIQPISPLSLECTAFEGEDRTRSAPTPLSRKPAIYREGLHRLRI